MTPYGVMSWTRSAAPYPTPVVRQLVPRTPDRGPAGCWTGWPLRAATRPPASQTYGLTLRRLPAAAGAAKDGRLRDLWRPAPAAAGGTWWSSITAPDRGRCAALRALHHATGCCGALVWLRPTAWSGRADLVDPRGSTSSAWWCRRGKRDRLEAKYQEKLGPRPAEPRTKKQTKAADQRRPGATGRACPRATSLQGDDQARRHLDGPVRQPGR